MHIPSSTYRVQLNSQFTFRHLESIIDYLYTLGISTIYAAPILQSTPGSMHGYDVIDPHKIDPEIGTLDELRSLSKKLRERKMTWLQDIVPNHMAFHVLNFRLMDVLERGPASPYYSYFDINWQHHVTHLSGKVQVPFLGKSLKKCIESKEVQISFAESGFIVQYFETQYPLSLKSLEHLFDSSEVVFPWKPFVQIGERVADYSDWKNDRDSYLASFLNDEDKVDSIRAFLTNVNDNPQKLQLVLDQQYYYLTYWKDTEKEINYRRFFTVNELICLRMEEQSVFDEYHTFLLKLYKEGLIQGLRIDHIDGLKDPAGYIMKLRQLFGNDCYVIAEKILESKEAIPDHWPLQGTSGYEFLAYINQLVTSRKGARQLVTFYRELVPKLPPYKEIVLQNKNMILHEYMQGEWDNLLQDLKKNGLAVNFLDKDLKEALRAIMISLPVYRIYPDKLPLQGYERSVLEETFEKAKSIGTNTLPEIEYLESLFLGDRNHHEAESVLKFLQRLMQFTGPLTAKGVEDTTFYVYNALISHDEVGDAPERIGMSIAAFHQRMIERSQRTPLSLNATATHDTKRGEDARLRLNALSEFPEEWKDLVLKWNSINQPARAIDTLGKPAPRINDEYYIYQSIVGGFPEDLKVTDDFTRRLMEYQTKVVREAKRHSDWGSPDENYEQACHNFIREIVKPESKFLKGLIPFEKQVQKLAQLYAIAQVILKCTTPGIPDIYQGCELWDLSFVDPDNRRQVDYIKRMDLLDRMLSKESEGLDSLLSFLTEYSDQGIWKLFVTTKILNLRKEYADLFTFGNYEPLKVTATDSVVVAFQRNFKTHSLLVVVSLAEKNAKEKHIIAMEPGAELVLTSGAKRWKNVFTGQELSTDGNVSVCSILGSLPAAVLIQTN